MIPPILHTVWFGKRARPVELHDVVDQQGEMLGSGWTVEEWTNDRIGDLPMVARLARERPDLPPVTLSDVARIEAVARYGGVYLDADVRLLKPLDPLLGVMPGWVVMEPDGEGKYKRTGGIRVANCAFAAIPQSDALNMLLQVVLDNIYAHRFKDVLTASGPVAWTRHLPFFDTDGWTRLPSESFIPIPYERRASAPTAAAHHHPNSYGIHEFRASWSAGAKKLTWSDDA